MDFIKFPESNRALTAPAGMEAEVGTLHVYNDGRQSISCWQPTQAEREAIAAGLPVWLGVLAGESQPPVWVSAHKPDMPTVVRALTPEWEDALRQFAERLPDPKFKCLRPMTGAEQLRAFPNLRQPNGEPLDPEKFYYIGSPHIQYQHLVNLREAFHLGGQAAVVSYLQPYESYLGQEEIQRAQ